MSKRKKDRTPWMDVTDDLPISVEKGQLLRFNQGGDVVALKIMHINKKGRIFAKYVQAYDREQVEEMARAK